MVSSEIFGKKILGGIFSPRIFAHKIFFEEELYRPRRLEILRVPIGPRRCQCEQNRNDREDPQPDGDLPTLADGAVQAKNDDRASTQGDGHTESVGRRLWREIDEVLRDRDAT